jgi:pimeloyl-ACP methyl ester carboxylesterase
VTGQTGGGGRPVASRAMPARALVVVILVAGLLAAACSGSTGQPARPAGGAGRSSAYPSGPPLLPAGRPPVTAQGYDAQRLRWRPCYRGFQCARFWVPFDYSRPAGRRFSLPVDRLRATGPGRRIGSLVVNPGGPGGSGVSYALQARSQVSPAVRARFDVVGFDPRGVGGSIPALHCLSDPQMDKYLATSDNPTTPAGMSALIAENKLFARACQRSSGALLPYVATRNAARDMDVLRAVLGDTKLTYLGKSYGTYLGTWYAQLFPSHVRALVLDGAVDPAESGFGLNKVQAQGFEVALRSFTADCVRMPACPLGHGSVSAGIAKLQGLLNQAAKHPLPSQIRGQPAANDALVLDGVAAALYSKSFWKYLREGLAAAFGGNGTVMVALADALAERNPNGHYSNLLAAETSVDCLDHPWPRSLAAWRGAAAAAAKSAPQFGDAIMWGSLPCAYWPIRPVKQVTMRAAGAPPILVVGTTRDPATPFRWAQALAGGLSSGVLLGWNGDGHTAYRMGSSCVDSAVDRYLISLVPPRSGTRC